MKEMILFNNNYLLINLELEEFLGHRYKNFKQLILLYLLVYENETNFTFEYLNTFSHSESIKYKSIFQINNIIALITDEKILLTKINEQKNNLEEFLNLKIDNNCNIEISKLKKDII